MAMTLRSLRVNKNLTQVESAEFIGVTPETIGKWEKGITFPNVPQLEKIQQLYDVNYNDINFLLNNVGLNDNED